MKDLGLVGVLILSVLLFLGVGAVLFGGPLYVQDELGSDGLVVQVDGATYTGDTVTYGGNTTVVILDGFLQFLGSVAGIAVGGGLLLIGVLTLGCLLASASGR